MQKRLLKDSKAEMKDTIKYSTIEEGLDYRALAQKMGEEGYVMNHTSARNWVIRSLAKISGHLKTSLNYSRKSSIPSDEIAAHPFFGNAVVEILRKVDDEL